jgi:hypothetical protein
MMNTPKQEIEITQQDLRQLNARLSNFLKFYWDVRARATLKQSQAADDVAIAIDEVLAKLEILKEAMR